MAEQTPESASLPDAPNLDWLRKQAKRRLEELRRTDPGAQLAQAQFELAKQYGFSSWRALKSRVDSLTVKGRLFDAARNGDVGGLTALLETDPDGLYARTTPYEHTLLHLAAAEGHLDAVELLLRLGLDVNSREKGDNTYPMHWAAAAGHADVVRKLADAGGDVIGSGDDHELEVIGWATCWDDGHDAVQRSIADFLVSRGARHHIFSAVALGLDDEVRRIVATSPGALSQRMSRHENHRLPLHFAVLKNRREMVELLLELGADPTTADGGGFPPSVYAAAPDIDRSVVETLARYGGIDLFGALVLGDEQTAARILAETGSRVGPGGVSNGALHLLAKRGDTRAVRWLLDHGADPNARWSHWDAEVTPLHLAAAQGHAEVVRLLLEAGADPSIRDTKHDGDAKGWAEHGRVPRAPQWREIVELLEGHAGNS
jgi:ankyrin repeat protein